MAVGDNQNEMAVFEWYARRVWPFQRLFLKKILVPRCKRCMIPETYSPLKDGVCDLCRNPAPADTSLPGPKERMKMTAELTEIFNSYSGKGREQFDALVLFSGGKDSIYIAHRLHKQFPKLRMLLFLIDNTFLPESAFANAAQVVNKMEVASFIFRPDTNFYNKIFRHAFLNLGKRESAVVVDQFDGDVFHDIARNFAVRHKIPLIISGVQDIQVHRYVGIHNYETPRSFEESERTHIAGLKLADFLSTDEMQYIWNGTLWPKEDIPRMLYPFYAWEYHEDQIVKEVITLNLLPKNRTRPLATNHRLLPLMGAVDYAHLGYSSYEPEFAQMVRVGKADAKYWRPIFEMQEYAIKTNQFLTKSIDNALARLSLTRKDLQLPE